jgi:hypothetical protein
MSSQSTAAPVAQHERPGLWPAWTAPAVVGVATVAATAVLRVRTPYAPGSYGVCPSVALFGVWCPACGGLRSVHELAAFDVVAAFAMNPLFVLSVPALVALWVWWLFGTLGRTRPPRLSVRSAWLSLAVLLVFGLARNVPALAPWLAP